MRVSEVGITIPTKDYDRSVFEIDYGVQMALHSEPGDGPNGLVWYVEIAGEDDNMRFFSTTYFECPSYEAARRGKVTVRVDDLGPFQGYWEADRAGRDTYQQFKKTGSHPKIHYNKYLILQGVGSLADY
jgi:hypothetical protein